MNRTRTERSAREELIGRRAELMAELFLQDLEADFVARSSFDVSEYDFLAGFRNQRGGINNIAVEVKSTERFEGRTYPIPKEKYNRWAYSNIPVLLLVVDVKENRYFYAWASPDASRSTGDARDVPVEVTEITEEAREDLLATIRS